MNKLHSTACLVIGFPLLLAADWPQWLGPNRNGVSVESVEPWKGDLDVLWQRPVGEGHSSPVVANGRVYVFSKVAEKEQEQLTAVNAETREVVWQYHYDRTPFSSQFGNGPRGTPLVDGDRVYTLGASGMLVSWDAETGEMQWKLDVLKEFEAANLFFGVSSSPVIEGDKLMVMVGGPKASIVALDKRSGKLLWQSGGDKASYASPIVTSHDGNKLAVFLTHQGVTALNPDNGKRHWQFRLVDLLAESSTTPVRTGDMLIASSVTYGSVGLRLKSDDGQPAIEQLWKNPKLTSYFATPIPFGDHLYMVTGQLISPTATLHCVETKSGEVVWSRKNVGTYHATLLLAKDRFLLLEEQGDLVLIEPTPAEYKELARSNVCGHTWAHPAFSDGKLYVRDEAQLKCVSLK